MAPPSARSEAPAAHHFVVPPKDQGRRLDQFLAGETGYSRARLSRWLKSGLVWVNDRVRAASYRVRSGDRIRLTVPPPEPSPLAPEPLPLDILYEDQELLLVNKPPGLVVHPAPGHRGGTLLNALLAHCPDLAEVGELTRPGLVHRLDKDTSGVMVVAKTAWAYAHLVRQFHDREVVKVYWAVVWGRFPQNFGVIELEVGRHPTERQKMSAHPRRGRPAVTRWRVLREYPGPLTLVELSPKTGRTHQLRVHLAALGHPVLGDATYGGGAARLKGNPRLKDLRPLVHRQLLHARALTITHPGSGQKLTGEAPVPRDFAAVLEYLDELK